LEKIDFSSVNPNFIIGVHSSLQQKMTGAIVAMHELAYKLAERGYKTCVVADPPKPHENLVRIPGEIVKSEGFMEYFVWDNFEYPISNTISIYPQITRGNPFGTKHVARWILYHTEADIEKQYDETDEYFNYSNFKTYREVKDRKLTVLDYKFDELFLTNFGRRDGICHIRHKNIPPTGDLVFEKLGSYDLTDWKERGGYEYLREKLNQYKYMLSYDHASYYSIAAVLCGCTTVLLNPGRSYEFARNASTDLDNRLVTPTEFRMLNPLQSCGIAYGWNDISWAEATLPFATNHLKEMEKLNDRTVDDFVDFWKKKLL